jgi:hypothetical protein
MLYEARLHGQFIGHIVRDSLEEAIASTRTAIQSDAISIFDSSNQCDYLPPILTLSVDADGWPIMEIV